MGTETFRHSQIRQVAHLQDIINFNSIIWNVDIWMTFFRSNCPEKEERIW